MSEMQTTVNSWKTKFLLGGVLIGALSGLAAAYLLTRTADERGSGPPSISTGDAIKAVLGVVGVVRGIAALGDD
jgi:hypothetical protein